MSATAVQGTDTNVAKLAADRAPLAAFRPLFKSRRDAVKGFAAAYSRVHSLAAAKGPCTICGAEPTKNVATYVWEARFLNGVKFGALEVALLFLGRIGVTMKEEVVGFNTFHPVCDACARRIRFRRAIANVLNFIGLFMVLPGLLFGVLGWAGMLYFDRPDDRSKMFEIALVGTGVVVTGLLCLWIMRKLRVPAALRYLNSKPIFSRSAKVSAGVEAR